VTRKYPLDPLQRVRDDNVDRKARALSDSIRQVEGAKSEREQAERRQHTFEREVAEATDAERERLTGGQLTAADLARGAAWGVAQEMERAAKARAAEEARMRQSAAEAAATSRRGDLADAKASAEVVAKHHDRWERAEIASSLARDEEDAEQAHAGRALRGGR
jgi:hypothetical protein